MYFFRKKDPHKPQSFNLKVMHIINTVAISLFILGILYKLVDWIFFS
ncbi:DUF6728 family protein [Olivibacter domesticus]|uniref:Uncharacterized protein n=1 Tax=Olivibacter domesticus TaxID=407022 RepID=A0A1H7SNT8_OLID1|nr:DUF6728 family protein [Olivibacter domesticus]SEL73137.1 hypothetical protein SAMN05661044_03271 [Olivibacter domesticus]